MTANEIRIKLRNWQDAADAITKNKSYTIDGLTVTKQDAETVQKQIEYWSGRLAALLTRRGSSFGVSRIRYIDRCGCR